MKYNLEGLRGANTGNDSSLPFRTTTPKRLTIGYFGLPTSKALAFVSWGRVQSAQLDSADASFTFEERAKFGWEVKSTGDVSWGLSSARTNSNSYRDFRFGAIQPCGL